VGLLFVSTFRLSNRTQNKHNTAELVDNGNSSLTEGFPLISCTYIKQP